MNSLYDQFKSSMISAIFSLVGKVWWKVAVISLAQTFITFIAMIPLFVSVFNWSAFKGVFEDPEGWSQQIEQNPELIFSFLGDNPDFMGLAVSLSIFAVVVIIIQAWASHCVLLINQAEITTGNSDLGEILSQSFNSTLFRILGGSLVLTIISAFVGFIIIASAAVSGWITFFLFFGGILFLLRFTLVFPLIVHAEMSIGDALSNSFKLLDWRRSGILFLAGIVFFIALVIAALMLGLFSLLLALIPIIGIIMYYLINILFQGVINAMTYGALSGLYYRFTELEIKKEDEDELSKHLISHE